MTMPAPLPPWLPATPPDCPQCGAPCNWFDGLMRRLAPAPYQGRYFVACTAYACGPIVNAGTDRYVGELVPDEEPVPPPPRQLSLFDLPPDH